MKVKFWGVRGSVPRPRGDMLRYGGNTSCVEIRTDANQLYVVDAGTGIVDLGDQLLREGYDQPVKLFLTHTHWDHLQGFPFFSYAFVSGKEIDVIGCVNEKQAQLLEQEAGLHSKPSKLEETLGKEYAHCSGHKDSSTTNFTKHEFEKQQSYKVFPVPVSIMGAKINFHDMTANEEYVNGLKIERMYLDHPQGAQGLRVREGNIIAVTCFDNEHDSVYEGTELGYPTKFGPRDLEKIAFMRGANVAIMDSQYTPEQYAPARFGLEGAGTKTWGHSTYESNIVMAKEAGVDHVIFTHYDIRSTDTMLDDYHAAAQDFARKIGYNGKITLAREGLGLRL